MKQSRAMSMVEAIANVAVGFWVAVTVQALVFPLFGFHAAPAQHLAIGAIFTGVSLIAPSPCGGCSRRSANRQCEEDRRIPPTRIRFATI